MNLLIITQKIDKNDDILGFFHGWVESFSDNVAKINVIALSVGESTLPSNVSIFSLGKEEKKSKFIQAIRFYVYLLKLLPKTDGIFVHMAPEYVKALYPLNIFFKKPVFMWYAHIHVSKIGKWALEKVDRIFTPSLESFSLKSDKVIPSGHGIDVKLFHPQPDLYQEVPIVMALSRISKVKRIEIFIEALHILRVEHKELKFRAMIVGGPARKEDFEYQNSLQRLASTYGLEDLLEWIGPVKNSETPRLYGQSSVFVRLQGGGGFGKTELEAMACGIPVILPTDVYNKSLGEFNTDLYFKEDDTKKCAENIYKVLLWGKDKKESYSVLARKLVVENHNIEKLTKRIALEFDRVLG
jgi:glycosyltransferase involved in cell wall biosynthesis